MGEKWFGASVKRKEDPAFLTGRGRYVDDIKLPGTLHAAFVRSPHAHALIRHIDAAAARALPGVHAVLTFADLPESVRRQTLPLFVPSPAIKQLHLPYALASDEVRYVGEAVAIVVADDRYIAEDAIALVDVDYEPLPAACDCRDALADGAPLAHTNSDSNIVAQALVSVGDTDRAFADAHRAFSESIVQHRGGAFFIECRGLVANFDPVLESLTVFVASQGSHRIKRALADMFEMADHQVRVVTPDVGGGFGPKGPNYPEYIVVAACAMQLGRPVKWIEDRRENFVATTQERDQYWDMEIAVDREARILGVRGRMIHDSGAYIPSGVVVPWISATTVPGPYVVPSYRLQYFAMATNKVPTSAVRGAGRPQAVVVMERLMDRVARELGLDPAEVRRRNFIQPHQMPYKVGILFRDNRPVTYDSGDYPRCLRMALEASAYDGFRQRQEQARRAGRYIGIGISNAVEATGLGPYESATVKVSTAGKIAVYTGATPQGQSHKTTLAQIVADQLGVGIDDVNVVTADTATVAQGMGSFAARTAVNAGNSVHLAAVQVAQQAKKIASSLMEVSEADLDLQDGFVQVRGVPGMRKSLHELAVKSIGTPGFSMAGQADPGLENTSYFKPDQATYSNGSHVCEVEVDIETGHVKILRFTVVHDCGRAINPLVVEGQVVGGVAHGIGNALFERMSYDAGAQPLTMNLGEYLLPTAPDVPNIVVHHAETATPLNPLGIKGAGEGGTIASIAAIVAAVENALAPFGVTIAEAPIMPQRIVELLGEAAHGRTQ